MITEIIMSKQYFPIVLVLGLIGFGVMHYSINWLMDSNSDISIGATDSYFHKMIVSKSNDINNSVTAMLKNQETASDASMLIRVYKQGTIHDTTYSAEEREINEKYKQYLDSAYTVVIDFVEKSENLSNDVEVMNEKRWLI